MLIGIQGSGKTTFYQERFLRTHVRISKDMLKTAHREQRFLSTCLETRQPFVVDNTNITAAVRAKFIGPARAAGFRVVGFYFRSDVKAALLRNSGRAGLARVPDKGLLGRFKRLQVPRREEGFDAIFYVRINNGEFAVEEWRAEQALQAEEAESVLFDP